MAEEAGMEDSSDDKVTVTMKKLEDVSWQNA